MSAKDKHSEPFHCPHCRSFYSMIAQAVAERQVGAAVCLICEQVMKSWNGRRVFIFHLLKQSEP